MVPAAGFEPASVATGDRFSRLKLLPAWKYKKTSSTEEVSGNVLINHKEGLFNIEELCDGCY